MHGDARFSAVGRKFTSGEHRSLNLHHTGINDCGPAEFVWPIGVKQKEFKRDFDAGLVSAVRVVPIPLASGWCIDVLIKELLTTGSRTATIESDRSTSRRRQVRRFATIDSAGRYLRKLGVLSFVVDMADSISFAVGESEQPDLEESGELDAPIEQIHDTKGEQG